MIDLRQLIKEALATIRKDFKGTDEEFDAITKEKSTDIVMGASKIFMTGLLKFYDDKRIPQIKDNKAEFLKKHHELYKDGFDMFLMFMDLQVTINTDMTNHFKVETFPEDERLKFAQLLHLHIRACQVANEIYTLLKAGYADAALARWRTLHETCVVFITLFDNGPKVSRMFFEYQAIEKLRRFSNFQIHHGTLNWKAIEEQDLNVLERRKAELVGLYGAEFVKDYGWAKEVITNNRTFKGLEEASGLSYLRPFYLWANKGVHAGPEGLFDRLGFDDVGSIPRQILAGPSMHGMVDPMQFTTYSLIKIVIGLIGLVDTLENRLLLKILELLHEEIVKDFIEVQNKLPK